MFQKSIENCRLKNSEPLRLFSKLKERKAEEKQMEQIYGVPMIESDASDYEENEDEQIQAIKLRLEAFKQEKARQIVKHHRYTKKSVESIINMLKDQLSYEALCIIDTKYKSTEKKSKYVQEGSTLPNSEERQADIQTPGFELEGTNGKPVGIDIDLREFTLGQKEDGPCHEGMNYPNGDVTEFQTNVYKSTKNIKNKIMMRRQ